MDGLEVMPMQMERMLSGIVVVKNNLDHVALIQNVSVRIVAID